LIYNELLDQFLEVYKFDKIKNLQIPKTSGYMLPVSKQEKDCFIIFLLVELSGHGLGFALVLAIYCFLAVLSKKIKLWIGYFVDPMKLLFSSSLAI